MELTQIKTGIFGYSKKSVCQYISEQNDIHTAEINAEKENAAKENEKLEAKITELEGKNTEIKEKNDKLNEKITSLEEEIASLKAKCTELEEANKAAPVEYETLEKETAELRDKSDVISTAIINAEKCATTMINDANVRAQGMIDDAQLKVDDEVKRLHNAKRYIIEVRGAVEDTLKKIDAELGSVQSDIDSKATDIEESRKAGVKEKFGIFEKNLFKRA